MIREILFWGDYYDNFYNQQEFKVKKKIDYVLWFIRDTVKVPIKFLRYLEDTEGLYEIKISTTFKEVRVLCFFDDNNVIVLINCFLKKTQKTPKNEIELGKRLKNEYFKFKERNAKK